jgi:uncharacterized membrane protein YeaQ/YmgE (transglycosylase-associated protein family)
MDIVTILLWIVVGAVAGWLAGVVMRGYGFGVLGNIIVGIIGAFIGGFLFNALGVGVGLGLVGSLIMAFIGAVILLFVIGLVRRSA